LVDTRQGSAEDKDWLKPKTTKTVGRRAGYRDKRGVEEWDIIQEGRLEGRL
jgi:hypothetical protein